MDLKTTSPFFAKTVYLIGEGGEKMGSVVSSRLVLMFITAFTEEGDPIYKAKQFQNIKTTATNEQLFETALALASLQKHELDLVERVNKYELG